MFRRAAAYAVLLLIAAAPASAQTIDEIVAKNLEARGGLEKLKAVQMLKMVAHLSSQGMELPMTVYAKRPNLTRKEVSFGQQTMVVAFDGTAAWQVNPLLSDATTPVEISGSDLDAMRRESEFDSPFVDYKARGYTIELVGTETAGGRTLHHLKLTRQGTTQECYLDGATGLEARTVSPSLVGPLEQEFADYRDVQGIRMPFMIRTLQNGARVAEIKVDRIDVNQPVDDALFRKPSK